MTAMPSRLLATLILPVAVMPATAGAGQATTHKPISRAANTINRQMVRGTDQGFVIAAAETEAAAPIAASPLLLGRDVTIDAALVATAAGKAAEVRHALAR